MLQKQTISISLGQGVDTKTDPKQVVHGKLLELENGIFIKPQSITKRNGYDKLGNVTSGYGLASYLDELIAFDGNNVKSYAPSIMNFTSKGNAVSLDVTSEQVIANTYKQTTQDSCFHSVGLKTFVWEDTRGGSRYSVVDSATGQYIVSDAVLDSTAATPKCFALGNYVLLVYYKSPGLSYKRFSVSDPSTLSSAVAINVNVVGANPKWDGTIIGDRLFISWNSTITSVSVVYINSVLTIASAVDLTTEVGTGGITVWGDAAQNVWVAYYNNTAVKGFVRDYNLNAVVAPYAIETVSNVVNLCGAITSETSASVGTSTLFYQISAAATYNHNIRTIALARSSTAVTPGSPSVFMRSVGLASKVFLYNSAYYLGIVYDSTIQPSYFIVNTSGVIVARVASQVAGGLTAKVFLPQVSQVNSSQFMVAWLEKTSLSVQSGTIFSNTGVISVGVEFLSSNTFLRATMSDNLHITGGELLMYDGVSVLEHGFHVFPEQAAAPTTSASGGNMSNGTYSYTFVYEWTDNRGNIHRSAPSIPQTVVVSGGGSNESVSINIPTLRLTQKRSSFNRADVVLAVYRTVSNGTIYYKVTSLSSPTINDPTADTVTFVDTISDTALIGNELLYTTGGVLENIPAPACSSISTFKTRIVIVPSENKKTFWISKEAIPGSPVEFSDAFIKTIDARDGDITAVAQMDEKLILFKLNTCWVTAGDGPNDTGTQDSLAHPELIQTDAGCTNPRSVVVTPVGLMRQSVKGIYLLDRSLQDTYIGAPVERFNDLEITSAQLIPNTNQVRFTTAEGTCLVFDYFFQQWSTFTNHLANDSTIFQNEFTYISPAGDVFTETPGEFLDDAAFIRLRAKTSWLSFAGLQGFQRVWQTLILGEYKSPHRLIVRAAYDFNPYPLQETYVDAGALLQNEDFGVVSPFGAESPMGGDFPLYQFRVFMTKQKCETIQLEIEEAQDSQYGEGFSISAFNFLVGLKSGTFKVDPTRSFA